MARPINNKNKVRQNIFYEDTYDSGNTVLKQKEEKQSGSNKNKTTITLAVDRDVLHAIREDAENQGVSINYKINSILSKFVLFYRMIELDESHIIASRTASFVLDNIDEDKWVEEYNAVIMDLVPALMLENKVMVTLENIINYLFRQVLLYCGPYKGFSCHEDKDGHLNLVFRHNKNIKWSRIMGKVYSNLLEKKLNYHTDLEVSVSSATIKILEKNVYCPA
jgi:hypothetical protein